MKVLRVAFTGASTPQNRTYWARGKSTEIALDIAVPECYT